MTTQIRYEIKYKADQIRYEIKYKADLIQEFIIKNKDLFKIPKDHDFEIITPTLDVIKIDLFCTHGIASEVCLTKCKRCNLKISARFEFLNASNFKWSIELLEYSQLLGLYVYINEYDLNVHGCNVRIMEQALI